MHEPSAFGVEMAIEKQERDKSLGIDQSQQNWFKEGSRTTRSEIHEFIYSIWKEELPEQQKELIIASIYKRGGL